MGRKIVLEVVPAVMDLSGMSILNPDFAGPALTGPGDDELLCGKCRSVLARGVDRTGFKDVCIRCFTCKSVNRLSQSVPTTH